MDNAISLVWFVLFGEDYETIPDPNKPENAAFFKAKRNQRTEQLRDFMSGKGKVLFDEWRKKVKRNQAALLSIPETEMCHCSACMIIRDTRKYIELLLEAENILLESKIN